MGLDMYLFRRNKEVRDSISPIPEAELEKEDVAYWRKANQVHDWFLDALNLPSNFNCGYAEVSKEILEDLITDCAQVLGNHKLAEELLPTCAGFFFGGTEYDQYYFDQLVDTIEQVNKIIEETDWDNQIIEYSCWW